MLRASKMLRLTDPLREDHCWTRTYYQTSLNCHTGLCGCVNRFVRAPAPEGETRPVRQNGTNMTKEEFSKFLSGRYAELLGYYDKRAVSAKRGHNAASIYVLVVSIAIAPLQALSLDSTGSHLGRVLVMILSPTLALATGIAAHFRCHENWLSYRSTWDALNRELSIHDAKAGPYQNLSDPDALFVERVEGIASSEGRDFYSRNASQSSAGHPGVNATPQPR